MRGYVLVLSLIAFALSILAFFTGGVSASLESGALTLISICATLVVGVSFVNVFEVHSVLRRMEDKMAKYESELEELEKLQCKVDKMRRKSNILFHHTWGLAFIDKQPYDALKEFWCAFLLAAKEDDIKRAKSCLENAKMVAEEIKEMGNNQTEVRDSSDNIGRFQISEELRKSKVYFAYSDKIEELLDIIRMINTQA